MSARTKRNFGYGRRMDYAVRRILDTHYGHGHFGTQRTHAEKFSPFDHYLESRGIRNLVEVTPAIVEQFAQTPEQQSKAAATQHAEISCINVVMRVATRGAWRSVSPSKSSGVERSRVRTIVPASLDRVRHDQATATLMARGLGRAAAIADAARYLGLRREEAAKLDIDAAIRQADETGNIDVRKGITSPKGGRRATRLVPVTIEGRAALEAMHLARPIGSRNLLTPGIPYNTQIKGWIADGQVAFKAVLNDQERESYHQARAAYACERYRSITGCDAPVVSGRRMIDRDADHAARLQISRELGHNRIEALTAYVGSSR